MLHCKAAHSITIKYNAYFEAESVVLLRDNVRRGIYNLNLSVVLGTSHNWDFGLTQVCEMY